MIRKIFQALQSRAVHPYFIAVLPVLSLYHDNMLLAAPSLLFRPAAVCLGSALLLVLLFRLLRQDSVRGGLLASALLSFVFQFVPAYLALHRALGVSYVLFLSGWLACFMAIFLVVGFSKKKWRKTQQFLNACSLLAAGILIFSIARFEWRQQGMSIPRFPGDLRPLSSLVPGREKPRPDIYYIILDAYGRDDVLRDIYGLDNEAFLRELEAKGFFVARASCANYSQTLLSLASSLNLRYLDPLVEVLGARSRNRRPLLRMIAESDLACFLKNQGYAIVSFDSLYAGTALRGAGATRLATSPLNDFEITLINNTLLRPHVNALSYRAHIRQVARSFAGLGDLDAAATPKFVFAHVICPHPPFVFSADGRSRTLDKPFFYNDGDHFVRSRETYLDYLRGYREQVLYVNSQLLRLIGSIQANSKTPPVIILQGDHGPGARLSHDNMQKTDLRERLGIFNAACLPGIGREAWSKGTTPVNTFRLVLNAYFNANLPRLADRSFFSRWHLPYAAVPVPAALIARRGTPADG
jgi:hypothetical protein